MSAKSEAMIDLAEPLRRFVRRRMNDSHAADDIVQDVLLKALANRESLPPDERLANWMYRVARNAIVDRYRTARPSGSLPADLIDDRAEEATVVAELSSCLRCMIDCLDEPSRIALRLADVDGRSQQEIADRMRISLSGAKSRVQRARRQLKAKFTACCDVQRDSRGNVTDFRPSARARQRCDDSGCDSCS